MSLQFETTHRTVIQGLRLTGIPLPWSDEASRSIKILNNAYIYFVVIINSYQFAFSLYTVMTIDDFE
ncbi:Odorant receptor 103, partial [Halyomorpha halys]